MSPEELCGASGARGAREGQSGEEIRHQALLRASSLGRPELLRGHVCPVTALTEAFPHGS